MAKVRATAKAKWRTLKHNGPQFQAPYKRLGRGLHLFKYKNKVVPLSKRSEEAVVMFASYLLRTNQKSKDVGQTFKNNFFSDWRDKYMNSKEKQEITEFKYCQFNDIVQHLKRQGELKKAMSKAEKERKKKEKEKNREKYKYVRIDGERQPISNPMVEPSGLFIGRGDNKNMGRIKDRIEPENVTINCSGRAPKAPRNKKWEAVVNDQTNCWLASYKDNITGKMKYIFPHPASPIKSKSEQTKYDKANELTREIARIRRIYQKDLTNEDDTTRQHATALYFLDSLALRVGNEKHAGETDTVGCCTLRKEHIRLVEPNKIRLKFVGKDSVLYEREESVLPAVFQNLKMFKQRKSKDELVFDKIRATSLNDYLSTIKPGLTAKVFRTFRATAKYTESIQKYTRGLTQENNPRQIKLAHLKANLDVAKLLNHVTMTKRATGRTGANRFTEKMKKLRSNYQRLANMRLSKASEEYSQRIEIKSEIDILSEEARMKKERQKWALATSLVNYIDPRVVKEFVCDRLNLDSRHVYSKAQRERFQWAFQRKRQKRKIAPSTNQPAIKRARVTSNVKRINPTKSKLQVQ